MQNCSGTQYYIYSFILFKLQYIHELNLDGIGWRFPNPYLIFTCDYLRKLFEKCSDDRERFLRSSETDLKIPLLKTINGQKAFSYRGPKLWNGLQRATKLAPSLKTFKEQL